MALNTSVTRYGSIPSNINKKGIKSERSKKYGVGFLFGSKLSAGFFHKDSGVEATIANIRQLLLTERGERVMLPNYGVSLKKYLFDPLDEITFQSIKTEIVTSLAKYAVGVKPLKLKVTPLDEFGANGISGIRIELRLKILEEEESIFDLTVDIE